MAMKRKLLKPGDTLITAYAQPANGPGWTNTPLYLIVRGQDGNLREECLQPDEQPAEVRLLYDTSAALHEALCWAVYESLGRKT